LLPAGTAKSSPAALHWTYTRLGSLLTKSGSLRQMTEGYNPAIVRQYYHQYPLQGQSSLCCRVLPYKTPLIYGRCCCHTTAATLHSFLCSFVVIYASKIKQSFLHKPAQKKSLLC